MRDFLRQFLLYSRSERRAVITLALLIVIVIVLPKAYHFYVAKDNTTQTDTSFKHDIAQWQKQDADTVSEELASVSISEPAATKTLFYFDPNTIGEAEWIKLGLSEKQAAGIERYKEKGGRFKTADDLRKMYSLTDADKERLTPYVKIRKADTDVKGETRKVSASYIIEINGADSAAYEALSGIGPVLSARIVKYRGLLGGFYKVEQVGEVYGISDTVFTEIKPHLKVNAALVRKLNINQADYEALRRHPYIHAKVAKAIVGYRENNGKFETLEQLEQLKQMKAVTDDLYLKILPYLTL